MKNYSIFLGSLKFYVTCQSDHTTVGNFSHDAASPEEYHGDRETEWALIHLWETHNNGLTYDTVEGADLEWYALNWGREITALLRKQINEERGL